MRRACLAVLAAVAVLVGGGCASAAPTSKNGRKPIKHRVVVDQSLVSPDGSRVAYVKHVLRPGKAPVGYVEVEPRGGQPRAVYSSNDSCCSNLVWASARVIALDDDYNVKTVDLTTGRVTRIAGFS